MVRWVCRAIVAYVGVGAGLVLLLLVAVLLGLVWQVEQGQL